MNFTTGSLVSFTALDRQFYRFGTLKLKVQSFSALAYIHVLAIFDPINDQLKLSDALGINNKIKLFANGFSDQKLSINLCGLGIVGYMYSQQCSSCDAFSYDKLDLSIYLPVSRNYGLYTTKTKGRVQDQNVLALNSLTTCQQLIVCLLILISYSTS